MGDGAFGGGLGGEGLGKTCVQEEVKELTRGNPTRQGRGAPAPMIFFSSLQPSLQEKRTCANLITLDLPSYFFMRFLGEHYGIHYYQTFE